MVEIKKRKIKGKDYFYIEQSYRDKKRVLKKQKYIGNKIPNDLEKIKQEFILGLYKEKWLNDIEIIKKNFKKELKDMPKSAKEKEIENFGIKFTYNTQKIEGSTLTLKETENLLVRGITPNHKPQRDMKEAQAHRNVFYEMLDYNKDLSNQIILFWHKKLLNDSKKDVAGKVRNHQVRIAMSKFIPPMPTELNFLLNDFFDWYKQNKNKIHPVILAALVHFKFVSIHPFSDGNGRISRIIMNFVLKKYDYPLLDISYSNRNSYYNALERSNLKKDENIFVQWFLKNYVKDYKNYLKKYKD
jgi:Fic family protein